MADLGVLDLLSPALSLVDGALRDYLGLAPLWRIVIFAALGSVASMSLFKMLSRQDELAELKQQISAVQKALAGSDAEPGDLRENIQRNLRLTGRQLWLSFLPALLASIPLLFLLAFSSNQFGVEPMKTGDRVYVTPRDLQGSPADFEWRGVNAQWDARKNAWTFYKSDAEETTTLVLGSQAQLDLPTTVPTRVIHKHRWWNILIANPAGYVGANASIDLFEFNTQAQVIISWGPEWMRGWLFTFMLFLILFSVAIKILWKIH